MKRIKGFLMDNYIIFCIYALIGWLYEVLWMWFVVPPFHFTNRGVLLGPLLPIYGFGMLLLFVVLKRFMEKKHLLKNKVYLIISVLVVTTFIYTTIIEYTTPKIYSVIDYLTNYGIGLLLTNIIVLIIVFILTNKTKLKNLNVTIILVFLAIWLISTSIEYISHFITDKCFNVMLWDYTKDFLNVNKRINWDASRNFAIGGTFLLYVVQPLINKLLLKLNSKKKLIITLVIGIPMIMDLLFRVLPNMIH